MITPKSGAPALTAANASITVESHPEIAVTTDSDGKFTVPAVTPGTVVLYVTSGGSGLVDGNDLELASGQGYGLKLPGIVVAGGKATDVGSKALQLLGSLSGTVSFFNNPNNLEVTGTDVYIPGTSFAAKTDNGGVFSMSGVPPGIYTVRFEHTGMAPTQLTLVTVNEGANTALGQVSMSLSSGPEGAIAITAESTPSIDGKATKMVTSSRAVTYRLTYDADAALMKVADEPTFLNRPWVPVATTGTWTAWTADGPKALYVAFSDLNGLASSPVSDSVVIDTQAPVLSSITLYNGWGETSSAGIYVDIAAQDSGSGVSQIMLSNTSNAFNSGETWTTYAPRVPWTLVASSGPKTVYAKVRDYAGRESAVVSATINVGAQTVISGALSYASPVELDLAHSPYALTTDVIFASDLTLDAGVTMNIAPTHTLQVNGVFKAVGSAGSHVRIQSTGASATNCGVSTCNGGTSSCGMLNLGSGLPGVSTKSTMQNVDFYQLESVALNGGTISQSTFDGLCSSGSNGRIVKTGLDLLTMTGDTITNYGVGIDVKEGVGDTIFQNNTVIASTPFLQEGSGTDSVVTGNSFTTYGTVYTVANGAMTITGNTIETSPSAPSVVLDFSGAQNAAFDFGGSAVAGDFIIKQEGTGTLAVSNLAATCNGANAVFHEATGSGATGAVTITNSTGSACNYIVLVANVQSGPITINHSAFAGGARGVVGNPSGGSSQVDVTFSHSDITVSSALVSVSDGPNVVATFDQSNVACINSGGLCDLFLKTYMSATTGTDGLILTNDNITCDYTLVTSTYTGCRGFTFGQISDTPVSSTFDLTVTGNHWSNGRVPASAVHTGNRSNQATEATSLAQIFIFPDNTGTNMSGITYNTTVTNNALSTLSGTYP